MNKVFNMLLFSVFLVVIAANLTACNDETSANEACPAIGVAQTGQMTCWDSEGAVVDCTGTGQDGEIQAGVESPEPRFTDNGDGTIKDNLTDRIWLKDWECPILNPGGMKTDWREALDLTHGVLKDGICGLTDGSRIGDWHLPNIAELNSLVDFENHNPALPTGAPFTGVKNDLYWSDSTNRDIERTAWQINFSNGERTFSSKVFLAGFVTAVRDRF